MPGNTWVLVFGFQLPPCSDRFNQVRRYSTPRRHKGMRMPTLKKAMETLCEVFCPEDKWPAMLQAGKKIREAGMVPKSSGRAIENMEPEHLAALVLSVPILLYYRRPIHEVPGISREYFDLTSTEDSRTAGALLASIISNEINSIADNSDESAYTVKIYLDKPEIDFTYFDKVPVQGLKQGAQIPRKTVRYGVGLEGNTASGSGSTMMRATVDIPSTALHAFAVALGA